jgi:hypothetical protein
VYEGGFLKGVRHGAGVYKWGDGMEYRGGFEEGRQHGCGIQVSSRSVREGACLERSFPMRLFVRVFLRALDHEVSALRLTLNPKP